MPIYAFEYYKLFLKQTCWIEKRTNIIYIVAVDINNLYPVLMCNNVKQC